MASILEWLLKHEMEMLNLELPWRCWWLEMNPLLKLLKKTLKLEEEMEGIWGDLGARVCLEEMGISLLIK